MTEDSLKLKLSNFKLELAGDNCSYEQLVDLEFLLKPQVTNTLINHINNVKESINLRTSLNKTYEVALITAKYKLYNDYKALFDNQSQFDEWINSKGGSFLEKMNKQLTNDDLFNFKYNDLVELKNNLTVPKSSLVLTDNQIDQIKKWMANDFCSGFICLKYVVGIELIIDFSIDYIIENYLGAVVFASK